jgi:hypothetical protein
LGLLSSLLAGLSFPPVHSLQTPPHRHMAVLGGLIAAALVNVFWLLTAVSLVPVLFGLLNILLGGLGSYLAAVWLARTALRPEPAQIK